MVRAGNEGPGDGPAQVELVPSVTWMAGQHPKAFSSTNGLRIRADKGWDETEAIKSAPGDKGSKVHTAVAHAGIVLGVPFVDHIVVGAGRYFSVKEMGMI